MYTFLAIFLQNLGLVVSKIDMINETPANDDLQSRQNIYIINNGSSESKITNPLSNQITCLVCNKQILDPSIPFIFNLDLFNDTCEYVRGNKYEVCEKNQACYVNRLI